MAADHVGYTMTWAGRIATITAPDGTTRTMGMRDFRTQREQARSAGAPQPAGGGQEDEAPAAGAAPPSASPPFTGGIRIGLPERWLDAVQGRRVVSRATVMEAFTRDQLAEILVAFSQMLSDADGAGPAGVFSQSEAALLAGLLHDQTVDLILARFNGDVTRFRASAAIAIIVAGKGRVHLQAIQRGGGFRSLSAARRPTSAPPITTVPDRLPEAPPVPWATNVAVPAEQPSVAYTATAPVPPPPAPEPEPAPAPAPASGPVYDRPSAVEAIFG
jgi:hypothetical protein